MENFKAQQSARLLLLYSTNLIQYNNGARFTVNRSVGKSPGRCKTETVMVWRSRFNNAISSNRGVETAAASVGARSQVPAFPIALDCWPVGCRYLDRLYAQLGCIFPGGFNV
jgi:hypothetical protein